MSDKPLFDIWAWSQIEAAADGCLDGERLQRMTEALARDARLRATVARAQAMNAALRVAGCEPPPPGLLGSLLAIPRLHPRARAAHVARAAAYAPRWSAAGGAVAAAALAAVVVFGLYAPPMPAPSVPAPVPGQTSDLPPEPPTARAVPELAAVHDFVVALAYLNKSAVVTGREVGAALNDGMTAALEVSRDSLSRRPD